VADLKNAFMKTLCEKKTCPLFVSKSILFFSVSLAGHNLRDETFELVECGLAKS